MQTIQFKKPVKTKTTRTVFVDLNDFLNEVENDEETTAESLDFRELRDDEITPELAKKFEEAQKMPESEFIDI